MPAVWSNAYGLCVKTSLPLPALRSVPGRPHGKELAVEWADTAAIRRRFSGPAGPSWTTRTPSGRRHTLQRGESGDHLITWDDTGAFLLTPGEGPLLCGGTDCADPAWQRFLLDTVLPFASVARGMEALHGAALRIRDGAVLVLGRSGAGKSSVAAEVLRGGAALVADDVVALTRTGEGIVVAHPAPAVMTLPSSAVPHPLRLASIDGEDWVGVARAELEPVAIRAVVLLDAADGEGELTRLPADPAALLRHALGIRWFPERSRVRDELHATLARQAPMFGLACGRATPSALARVILWSRLEPPTAGRAVA